jgi:hypothetical protein
MRARTIAALATLALLAGCSSNGGQPDASGDAGGTTDGATPDAPATGDAVPDSPVDADVDAGAASDAADAPIPQDAGGGNADDGAMTPRSDAALYFDDQFARFAAGQTADFTGDGVPDTFVEATAGGGTRVRRDLNQDGVYEVVIDTDSAGNSTTSLDDDGDGMVDRTDTTQVGPPFVRVERWDEDHDGLFERRRTSTTDDAAGTIHVVVEANETAAHSATVVSDETVDLVEGTRWLAADKSCLALPVVDPDTPGPASKDHISIPTHESAPSRYCNKQEAARLRKAFDCAESKARQGCLDNLDPNISSRILKGLKDHGLRVSCGVCPGAYDALTQVGGSETGFNHDKLAAEDDAELCEGATHELMHMAGYAGSADHDTARNDKVYACARTCNGCTSEPAVGAGISTSPGRDCAMCAEGLENKKKCGAKTQLVGGDCPPQYTLCHTSFANSKCTSCKNQQMATCDDVGYGDATFNCCASCNSPNDRNDQPCDNTPPKECSQKPGYCP